MINIMIIESIVIDFAKKHEVWINLDSSNSYGIKISRNDDEECNICVSEDKINNIELLVQNIKNGYIISEIIEQSYFESLDKKLKEIYKETVQKWDDEDEKEYQKYLEIKIK